MKAAAENGRNGTSSQVYAPGTRRSARHNGQQPEISITDPLQLERKLKRQRSTSAAATPSDDESGERGQKRSRLASEDNEHDPLDLLGSALSPERQGSVRFADQVERAPTPPQDGQILVTEESVPSIEPLRRNGGFDPSLLNPLPSPGVAMAGPSTIAIDAEHNPFLSPFPYRPEQGPDVSTQFQPQFNFPPVQKPPNCSFYPCPHRSYQCRNRPHHCWNRRRYHPQNNSNKLPTFRWKNRVQQLLSQTSSSTMHCYLL